MPRYFSLQDLLNEHQIKLHPGLLSEHPLSDLDMADIFSCLFDNNVKNSELLESTLTTLRESDDRVFFKSLIDKLALKKLLNTDILTTILQLKTFKKILSGCERIEECNLLTPDNLQKILVKDIENQVEILTKPFPVKKSYLYFKKNYSSHIQWGLGVGFGMSSGFYLLTSLKVLSFHAFSAHPLIGLAMISLSVLILFILAKACQDVLKPAPYLST